MNTDELVITMQPPGPIEDGAEIMRFSAPRGTVLEMDTKLESVDDYGVATYVTTIKQKPKPESATT